MTTFRDKEMITPSEGGTKKKGRNSQKRSKEIQKIRQKSFDASSLMDISRVNTDLGDNQQMNPNKMNLSDKYKMLNKAKVVTVADIEIKNKNSNYGSQMNSVDLPQDNLKSHKQSSETQGNEEMSQFASAR